MRDEVLRGRVVETTLSPTSQLVTVWARVPLLDGALLDIVFHLASSDPRLELCGVNFRIFYTRKAAGQVGAVTVPGDDRPIPVETAVRSRADYAAALLDPDAGAPPIRLRARAEREAEKMGFVVWFQQKPGGWEVCVGSGRGHVTASRNDHDTWEDTMKTAGLGGTIE